MNSRTVLAVSAVLLFLLSELVGKGGPIDSLASPATKTSPRGSPASLARASSSKPEERNDFFANYEPPKDIEPSLVFDRPSIIHTTTSSSGNGMSGSLTQQQLLALGLEVPSPLGVKSYESGSI